MNQASRRRAGFFFDRIHCFSAEKAPQERTTSIGERKRLDEFKRQTELAGFGFEPSEQGELWHGEVSNLGCREVPVGDLISAPFRSALLSTMTSMISFLP